MRTIIATVFNYSLDGVLADEGTGFWDFCFSVSENAEPDNPAHLELCTAPMWPVEAPAPDQAFLDSE